MLRHDHAEVNDRGVAIIFVALTLIVLMIFTAFAVDLGKVYAERRHDQGAVDASATSGAVQFLSLQSQQHAVDEIVDKVERNLGRSVDWTGCTDANQLDRTATEFSLTPATPCISFSSGFNRLRVRLPDQVIATSLAGVIGIDSFTSSAFAEVTIAPRGGGSLPFVVLAGNGPGDDVCLRVDNSGGVEPPNIEAQPPYAPRDLDPCDEDKFVTHGAVAGP